MIGVIFLEETLRLILNELQELKIGQARFQKSQDEMKQSMSQLQEVQVGLSERQERFQETQEEMKESIGKLQEAQVSLNERQERFRETQEEMKERQQRLSQDVKTIKEHLFSSLGMYFESVEKHIDEKTKELKIVLEEQQKVIDTLAVRSVKHESEIRDIKRILESR